MRALITIALFALVFTATCEGAADHFAFFQAQAHAEMREKLAKLATAFKENVPTLRRDMKIQQETADPICATAESRNVITEGLTQCATATEFLATPITSAAMADSHVSSFCSGSCGTYIANADVRYLGCLPPDAAQLFDVLTFMCKKRAEKYCGAALLGLAVSNPAPACETKFTQADCATLATSGCQFVNNKCELRLTNAALEQTCNPCLDLFAQTFKTGSVFGPELLGAVQQLQGTICLKQGGDFCYPQVQDIMSSFGEFSQTQIDGVCTAPSKLICLGKIMQVQLGVVKNLTETAFLQCANSVQGDQTLVAQRCKPLIDSMVMGFNSFSSFMSNMCTKNAAGLYCFGPLTGGSANPQAALTDECFNAVIGAATCNATCAPILAAVVESIGCCLGSVHNVLFAQQTIPESAYPTYTKTGTAPAATPASTSVAEGLNLPYTEPTPGAGEVLLTNVPRGGLEGLGACSGMAETIRGKLALGCASEVKRRIRKSLKLKLRWSSIQGNTALVAKLVESLTRDFASAAGVGVDNVKNAELVEDTTVTVAAASGRRQTTGSSGTKFQAEIEATTNAVTDQASAAFDAAASSGALSLTTTQAVIQSDCTNCQEANSALVAGTESSSTPTSNAAIVSASAAVLAVLAMLL